MTYPVRAFKIIYVLHRLGLLEQVKANPKRAALVFLVPHSGLKGFERQDIISDGVSPHSIKDIHDIGPAAVKTFADKYGIKTVDKLKTAVDLFKQEKVKMKEKKHRSDWLRAVRSWGKHVELNKTENIAMMKNIPQYISPSD
ncbi:hypothetical protein GN958_ATG07448 [Phytophthora infestans]|nr:hypothetical protein GN958_ATG07448 [Phytophthora infestans]